MLQIISSSDHARTARGRRVSASLLRSPAKHQIALAADQPRAIGRPVQVHSFASQRFTYSDQNNYLTMPTSDVCDLVRLAFLVAHSRSVLAAENLFLRIIETYQGWKSSNA
jgi:hypothetical protein